MTNWMAREGARLVENGYRVLPVWPGHKAPATFTSGAWHEMAGWTKFCERWPTDIEIDHWSSYPECSIGIAGGNVVGIDIDILDQALSYRIGELAKHVLGETPALRIGRAPKQLLVYRAEKPFQSSRAGPIEVLCLGRQFVAFGTHPDTGRDYHWPIGTPSEVAVEQLPRVSQQMVQQFVEEAMKLLPAEMRATRPRTSAPTGVPKDLATHEAMAEALRCIPNAGPDYNWWLSIGMAIHEALAGEGLELWHEWSSRASCYDAQQLDKKWPSFGRYGGERVGAGTIFDEARRNGWTPSPGLIMRASDAAASGVEVDFAAILAAHRVQLFDPPPAVEEPTWTVPAGEPSWRRDLSGGLKMLVDHADATAVSPQPWVALGGALALFGALAGRRYMSPTGLRTNIYTLGIADSGGGKDHPLGCVKQLLKVAELERFLGGERLASGAGMISALEASPSLIFPVDEFGFLMQAVADRRRAPKHATEIIDNLTAFYSAANKTFLGTEYGDKKLKARKPIEQPCMSLYGVTTPQVFWSALSSAHVMDGSLARILIFETANPYPDPRFDAFATTFPAELVQIAKAVAGGAEGHDTFPSGDTSAMAPNPYIVRYADEAAASRARDIQMHQTTLLREHRGSDRTSVLARLGENAFKVALIRAIADDPLAPVITAGDLEWAYEIADQSVQTILRAVAERVADNEDEAKLKRVLRVIIDAGAPGIVRNELTRKTQFLRDDRQRSAIVDDLITSGQVRADSEAPIMGRARVTYYAQ